MNYGNSFDMLNLSSQAVQGQLFFNIDTEELFVFGENTYSKICSNNTNNSLKFNKPTNCKNCGAPLVSCKCEYCGTIY